jgi:hypothetical protein
VNICEINSLDFARQSLLPITVHCYMLLIYFHWLKFVAEVSYLGRPEFGTRLRGSCPEIFHNFSCTSRKIPVQYLKVNHHRFNPYTLQFTLLLRRCIQKFPDWVDNEIYAYNNKHALRSITKGYGSKTHKTAIQLHLVAESCTICSSRFRRPVRKLLDIHSYHSAIQRYLTLEG